MLISYTTINGIHMRYNLASDNFRLLCIVRSDVFIQNFEYFIRNILNSKIGYYLRYRESINLGFITVFSISIRKSSPNPHGENRWTLEVSSH